MKIGTGLLFIAKDGKKVPLSGFVSGFGNIFRLAGWHN